jgi:hypothetical protein
MLTRHHKKPKSLGGMDNHENIIMVDDKLHKAFHRVFFNMNPEQIAWELNHNWIDPNWTLVAVPTHIMVAKGYACRCH